MNFDSLRVELRFKCGNNTLENNPGMPFCRHNIDTLIKDRRVKDLAFIIKVVQSFFFLSFFLSFFFFFFGGGA